MKGEYIKDYKKEEHVEEDERVQYMEEDKGARRVLYNVMSCFMKFSLNIMFVTVLGRRALYEKRRYQ